MPLGALVADNVGMTYRMVHGVRPTADEAQVAALLEKLPPRTTGTFDRDLRTLVVDVAAGGDPNEVLGVLAESGIVAGAVLDDRAVPKYLPERAALPARWDGLDDDADDYADTCTSCGWSTPPCSTPAELLEEKRRHEGVAHP